MDGIAETIQIAPGWQQVPDAEMRWSIAGNN
jgi:hypothetical protein